MSEPRFRLAELRDAKSVERIRADVAQDLTVKLGQGHWSGASKLASIRERIKNADPTLRHSTIYVLEVEEEIVGSVVVSTYPPGFWRKSYWSNPAAGGLGIFNLSVAPGLQRKGFGKELMDGCEALAREHKIPFVRLDAYTANPFSNGFYHAIGYQLRATINLRGVGLNLYEKAI